MDAVRANLNATAATLGLDVKPKEEFVKVKTTPNGADGRYAIGHELKYGGYDEASRVLAIALANAIDHMGKRNTAAPCALEVSEYSGHAFMTLYI